MVSSLKFHGCTTRGAEGSARETRRCLKEADVEDSDMLEEEVAGKGAVKENEEIGGVGVVV